MKRSLVTIDSTILPPDDEAVRTAMPVFVIENHGLSEKNVVLKGRSFAEIAAGMDGTNAKWDAIGQKSVSSFFSNGGEVCYVLLSRHLRVNFQKKAFRLAEVERDVPEATLLVAPETYGYLGNWTTLLTDAATSNRLFCLIDLPENTGDAFSEITKFTAELSESAKSAGAAYWPYLIERSVSDGKILESTVAPSAAAAAAIQRTDATFGVWGAPANVRLPAVLRPISHTSHPDLLEKGANTVRTFPGRGALLWGARTMVSDTKSPTAYIQTKRTITFIQNGLQAQLRPMVFDVNNALLWRTCEARVTAYLTEIWRAGGLAGATANAAFSVQVGEGITMTAEDIAQGKLIMAVSFTLHPILTAVKLALTMRQGESHIAITDVSATTQGATQ